MKTILTILLLCVYGSKFISAVENEKNTMNKHHQYSTINRQQFPPLPPLPLLAVLNRQNELSSIITDHLNRGADDGVGVGIDSEEDRSKILASIQKLIAQAVEMALEVAQNLQIQISNLFNGLYITLGMLQTNANKQIDELINYINKTIELNNSNRKDVGKCIDEHMPELTNISSESREKITECIKSAGKEVNAMRDDVQQYLDNINDHIDEISEIIGNCVTAGEKNPFQIAQCVVTHLRDVIDSIIDIYNDGKEAVKVASVQIFGISSNTQVCVLSVVDEARQETSKVIDKIQQCVAEKEPPPSPPHHPKENETRVPVKVIH